jgi:CubicO group peptidase (beta-lactamase class C family)
MKYGTLVVIAFSFVVTAMKPGNAQVKNPMAASKYRPPTFTDADRVAKIQAAFPLIEKLYKSFADKNDLPSVVFGLVVDGKLVFSGSQGFSNISSKTAANTKSAFRIASMTKSLTAMAIIKLRDEAKLRLDDPVHTYIPEIAKVSTLTSDAPVLTIRHLLIHAGGFPQDDPWGDRQLADTDDELLKLISNGLSYSNVPGLTYEYSNLGYTMLGQIISKVSGRPFGQYITEKILKPLGMNETYWEYEKVPGGKLAMGYRWLNNKWNAQPLLHHGAFGAMGGLITSIEDFTKYMAYHMQAWPPDNVDDTKIIKNSSVREMHHPWNFASLDASYTYSSGRACPMVTAYAYGLRWTKDCEGRVSVGHAGGLPGFGSHWMILPEYGVGVVSFSNLTYAPMRVINTTILDTLVALSQIKPRALPPSAILRQRQNELVKFLPEWDNASASKIFADNFFLDYPIDSLRKSAKAFFAEAGKISQIGEVIPQNQLRGTFILYGEKKNISVYFTLSPQLPALIQTFDIREARK